MKKTPRDLNSHQDVQDLIAALTEVETGGAVLPPRPSSATSQNSDVPEDTAEVQRLSKHLARAEDDMFRVFVEIFKLAEASKAGSKASNAEPAPTTPADGE